MLKQIVTLAGALLAALPAAAPAGLNYFGATGLAYMPTAGIVEKGALVYEGSNQPASLTEMYLMPACNRVAYGLKNHNWEIGLSSTYIYGGNSVDGFKKGSTVVVPIIPSLKYQMQDRFIQSIDVAFGAQSPYGLYSALDWRVPRLPFPMVLHACFGSKLVTFHGFAGCDMTLFPQSYPLVLSAEGGWGGVSRYLGQAEESYLALGMGYSWGQTIDARIQVRQDFAFSPDERTVLVSLAIHKPRWKK